MTDDDLFFEFVEQVQRRVLNGCRQWVEPGVEPYSIERAGKLVRFNADRARLHGDGRPQVYEAVARLCIH